METVAFKNVFHVINDYIKKNGLMLIISKLLNLCMSTAEYPRIMLECNMILKLRSRYNYQYLASRFIHK